QSRGRPPAILSPHADVSYVSRALASRPTRIALRASADSDVRKLFWFVNGDFLGESPPRSDFFWKANVGTHLVRVVDELGRSAQRRIKVTLE
ncbi:MAG TPA: hypothetical protein VFV50_06810, partial [Bdellovibrionales bacterium]|nr:hypothetical protein [Bdellovibrionales bacterium]